MICAGERPVCDHCGGELELEYRPLTNIVRWTHATGPIGRWSCPDGSSAWASVGGVQWFDAGREVAS